MAFTRSRNDPGRLQKELQQSSFAGRYMLNAPGNGLSMPYFEDPQMRIQKWGANTWTDSTNLESELRGLGKVLDHNYDKTYKDVGLFQGSQNQFHTSDVHVDESRATHPAWMYRNTKVDRWDMPLHDPQQFLEKRIPKEVNTRIEVKNQFRRGL